MKTALRISGLLFGFLLFLSITIKNKPIFAHIYNVISPATKFTQETTEDLFNKLASGTHAYTKKLFENSVPKLKDSVDSKLSSQLKNVAEPAEKITTEEKAELDQLIKNH